MENLTSLTSVSGSSRVPLTEGENHMSRVVSYLDKIVKENRIVQSIPDAGLCRFCGASLRGYLDYTKLPSDAKYIGDLQGLWSRLTTPTLTVGFGTDSVRDIRMTPRYISIYSMKQLIVKSGIFCNEQLRGCRLSHHEMEVNEKSFLSVRPGRCNCFFSKREEISYEPVDDSYDWSMPTPSYAVTASIRKPDQLPDYATPFELQRKLTVEFEQEWDSYKKPGVLLTEVERDFILGKPVRTGKRSRSPEARQRRARKRSSRKGKKAEYKRVVRPVPSLSARGTGLMSVNTDSTLILTFKYLPPGSHQDPRSLPWRFNKAKAESMIRKDLLYRPSKAHTNKDMYFLRKRGRYYRSLHHSGDVFLSARESVEADGTRS